MDLFRSEIIFLLHQKLASGSLIEIAILCIPSHILALLILSGTTSSPKLMSGPLVSSTSLISGYISGHIVHCWVVQLLPPAFQWPHDQKNLTALEKNILLVAKIQPGATPIGCVCIPRISCRLSTSLCSCRPRVTLKFIIQFAPHTQIQPVTGVIHNLKKVLH